MRYLGVYDGVEVLSADVPSNIVVCTTIRASIPSIVCVEIEVRGDFDPTVYETLMATTIAKTRVNFPYTPFVLFVHEADWNAWADGKAASRKFRA